MMSSSDSNSSTDEEVQPINRRTVVYQGVSLDKKKLLIKLFEEGETLKEAANVADIKLNTAKTIIRRYNQSDCNLIQKKRGGNRPSKLTPVILSQIEEVVECNAGATLSMIQNKLLEKNVVICKSTLQNALCKLRITLKLASLELENMNSERTIALRKEYAIQFSVWAHQNHDKLIFIDESGFNLHLRRRHARSKKNTPARIILPTIRGRNVTLIAGLTDRGIIHYKIISNSTCNSNKFCEFIEELVAKLESTEYYFVMDNAQIHKTAQVKNIIENSGNHLRFLPPYSPMLNPIEQAFSKIKSNARNLLGSTREQNMVEVIRDSVNSITSADSSNFIMDMMMTLPAAAAGEILP